MSTWRQKAIEVEPELKNDFQDPDLSPYTVFSERYYTGFGISNCCRTFYRRQSGIWFSRQNNITTVICALYVCSGNYFQR